MQSTTCPMCDGPSTAAGCCSDGCTSRAERELHDNAAQLRRTDGLSEADRAALLARNAELMRGLLGRVRRDAPDARSV